MMIDDWRLTVWTYVGELETCQTEMMFAVQQPLCTCQEVLQENGNEEKNGAGSGSASRHLLPLDEVTVRHVLRFRCIAWVAPDLTLSR